MGSAVCVYSFDSSDSLVSVFLGKYLRETTLDQFEEVENTDPFSVSTNDARTHARTHTRTHTHRENEKFPKNQELEKKFHTANT